MYEGVAVVEHNPLRTLIAIIVIGFDAALFEQLLADVVGYLADLCG